MIKVERHRFLMKPTHMISILSLQFSMRARHYAHDKGKDNSTFLEDLGTT
jgi:hypothetical protein